MTSSPLKFTFNGGVEDYQDLKGKETLNQSNQKNPHCLVMEFTDIF